MVGRVVLKKPAFGFVRAENNGTDYHFRPSDAKQWHAICAGDWVRFVDDRTEQGLVARKVELLPDNRLCKPVTGRLERVCPGYAFLRVFGTRLLDRELLGRQVFFHISQAPTFLCEEDVGRQLSADVVDCERGKEAIHIRL